MNLKMKPFLSGIIDKSQISFKSKDSTFVAQQALIAYIAQKGFFDELSFGEDGTKVFIPHLNKIHWHHEEASTIINDENKLLIYSNECEGHIEYWAPCMPELQNEFSNDSERKLIIITAHNHELAYTKNLISIGYDYWDMNCCNLWTYNRWFHLLNHSSVKDAIYDLCIPVGFRKKARVDFLKSLNDKRDNLTIVTDDNQSYLDTDLRFGNLGIEVYFNKLEINEYAAHASYPSFYSTGFCSLDHLPHKKMHGIARVNVVLETTAYKDYDSVYYTEKTAKVLANNRPFVILGDRGLLRYLKRNGFKTFNDFCDESYDDEVDLEKKIDKIIAASKQLVKSCKHYPDEIDAICKHNYYRYFDFERQTNIMVNYGEKLFKYFFPGIQL
jgi:hypothetical protein